LHYDPNPPATARKTPPAHVSNTTHPQTSQRPRRSFLAWPAWQRMLAVLPVLGLLWLGVLWAQMEAAPW